MPVLDDRAVKESPAWGHMKAVVATVVSECPRDAVNNVESLSQLALTGKMHPPPSTSVYQDQRPKGRTTLPAAVGESVEWARQFARQVVPPKPAKKEGEEEDEPAQEEDKGELPDVATEQAAFRQFGFGLGDIEAVRVWVALKRLLDKEPLAKVRFWGKILGTKRDYYVAEAKIDEGRVPERDAADEEVVEETGKKPETIYQGINAHKAREAPRVLAEEAKGVNENKYYVSTSDDLTEWVQLPDVLPSHITGARQITNLMTGFLDARVSAHPPFPGSERHYLRAQIARITHATLVAPKDIFAPDEVEDEVDDDGNKIPRRYEIPAPEEVPILNPREVPDASDAEAVAPVKAWFGGFKHDELLQTSNWVHIAPQLLQEGRVTKFKSEEEPPADDDVDEDPPAPAVEYVNPVLSDLEHDAPFVLPSHSKSTLPAWTVRKAYWNPSELNKKYLAKSLLWPGAATIALTEDDKPGATYVSCYVGRGLKDAGGHAFAPALPPLPCIEFPVSAEVRLQKDCTRDDELDFEPAPPPPKIDGDDADPDAADDDQ